MDDILLASNDLGMLHAIKHMLTRSFDMKDLDEAFFVLGIKIHKDRSHHTLELSQKTYIDRVLGRFNIQGDKFNKDQCPENEIERAEMNEKPFQSALGSLIYA